MENIKFNRSEILKKAHSYKADGLSWSDAQRKAWKEAKAETVKTLLTSNVVTFQFLKEDKATGLLIVRTAKGTLNTNLFTYQSKGNQTEQNPSVVKYWDIEANGFRCFKKERFIKILNVNFVNTYAKAA